VFWSLQAAHHQRVGRRAKSKSSISKVSSRLHWHVSEKSSSWLQIDLELEMETLSNLDLG